VALNAVGPCVETLDLTKLGPFSENALSVLDGRTEIVTTENRVTTWKFFVSYNILEKTDSGPRCTKR
jgi:hypothetical protein